jgi:glycosyltransferase involved in cell wall biosynthesis
MINFSLVVPIYNDGSLSENFCREFQQVFVDYLDKENIEEDVELIFVNDGSSNNSYELLKTHAAKYKFVKAIDLSRNFGQHIALSCGYANAKGQYVGMMNVDMQEHPRETIKYLEHFKSNPDVDFVLGLRSYRNDGFMNTFTSKLFILLLNKLTGDKTPVNSSTLRVMSRKFVNAYLLLSERSRYLPALENWLGFKHGYVNIDHRSRETGKSSYTFKKRLAMAFEAITSFSDLPLRIATRAGFIIAVIGLILTCVLIIQKLFFIKFQPGYSSTLSVIVFLSGVQIMFIGMASIYIGRIFREVQGRPLYVIRETTNL